MAQYKFNRFHWHLTDDNGWRIEIKSLPKLTDVGAWRVERQGPFGDRPEPKPAEPATYGGFYTHDDIREVVRYAAERNVIIVPEIDVPGHSMAALAAYPELSTRKEPKFVNPGTSFAEWYGDGKFRMLVENTLNPADEKVYEFLEKVFAEVASLFPRPVHSCRRRRGLSRVLGRRSRLPGAHEEAQTEGWPRAPVVLHEKGSEDRREAG
jgi:hexosaminidase